MRKSVRRAPRRLATASVRRSTAPWTRCSARRPPAEVARGDRGDLPHPQPLERLVEDLANPENALPEELRAALISIGLWIMREAEAIRLGRSDDFSAMIEITAMIRDGLGE